MWRKIWISNGSLCHGHVADTMRRTRAKYHYVIRRTKNNSQLLKNRAKARAIAQRKSRELWTEVNKIKSSKTHATNCMDNVTGSEQIVNRLFLINIVSCIILSAMKIYNRGTLFLIILLMSKCTA